MNRRPVHRQPIRARDTLRQLAEEQMSDPIRGQQTSHEMIIGFVEFALDNQNLKASQSGR